MAPCRILHAAPILPDLIPLEALLPVEPSPLVPEPRLIPAESSKTALQKGMHHGLQALGASGQREAVHNHR